MVGRAERVPGGSVRLQGQGAAWPDGSSCFTSGSLGLRLLRPQCRPYPDIPADTPAQDALMAPGRARQTWV